MFKSRKSKYMLIVVMALCLVIAFSAYAFAGVVDTVGGVILDAVNSTAGVAFKVFWFPNSANAALVYSNGFAYYDSVEFSNLNTYVRDYLSGDGVV
ncbi:MAG: hypothetical protein IJP33_05915 [Firmicutes bacterium]|nr:hypothetical protein [Bacillota bacterium]